jgi:hypothetical protein
MMSEFKRNHVLRTLLAVKDKEGKVTGFRVIRLNPDLAEMGLEENGIFVAINGQ